MPDERDPFSSITRQLIKKLALWDRRFPLPLPYEEHVPGTAPKAVWEKLQKLRSTIAHGRPPQVRPRQLVECLRSLRESEQFVRLALKAMMARALEEPQLVADLRDC